MADVRYRHTQSQPILAIVVLIAAIATFAAAAFSREAWLLITPAILALIAGLAYSLTALTTTVTAESVEVAFRWGWPKRIIEHQRVVRAETVRNRWWYGLGIRRIPGAWMFNVWTLDAVHLELADGLDFRIGTDDPTGLEAAIRTIGEPGR